ncbi:hypothetical protein [Nitrobacter vulgaris]|uniref:Glycosyltransferase RgtA/B/C/D-like domain-containing protein n=1 Tax=Nitrobacter vulgaris TaxID=29421 RepID=A0A1V4HWU0_NITVU|nr:hypothetical protein [Nitrobacter vulgaris]OPH82082.1 hypothetical protein B2M20_12870 [Nitrobacter vulgaris]
MQQSSNSNWLFVAACAILVLAGYLLLAFAPVADPGVIQHSRSLLLPNAVGVFPEPQDPFMFVGLTLVGGLLLLGVAIVARWSGKENDSSPFIFWCVALIALAVLIIERSFSDTRMMVIVLIGIGAAVTVFFFAPRVAQNKTAVLAVGSLYIVTTGLVLAQRVWTEGSLLYGWPISLHYEAVTSSLIRIASGGTCLADVLPQYGCYGEFLTPVLRIFGSSILVVSSTFAVFLVVAVWSALAFTSLIIRNKIVLLGGSLCLVMTAAFNLRYDNVDPVLQYYPLRFFFPAVSLLVAVWLQSTQKKIKYLAVGIFSGAAIAWNLESGLAVFLSLAGFICFGSFSDRNWSDQSAFRKSAKNLLFYFCGCLLFVVPFVAFLFVKSNGAADLRGLIVFQQVFAVTGFGMIAVPAFPSYWTIHATIIFAVLFMAAVCIGNGTHDRSLELAAYLALLGVGLTVYYVGRSHILVLRLVMWPSVILLFFLLDRTVAGMATRVRFVSLLALLSITVPATFFVSAVPGVVHNVAQARSAPSQANNEILEDISFIRSQTLPGEPVGIIALDQGVLYGQTSTRSALQGPGVVELVRRIDLERLMEFLVNSGPKKLFIGTSLENATQRGLLDTDIPIDLARLRSVYDEESVPGGRLIYMQRNR